MERSLSVLEVLGGGSRAWSSMRRKGGGGGNLNRCWESKCCQKRRFVRSGSLTLRVPYGAGMAKDHYRELDLVTETTWPDPCRRIALGSVQPFQQYPPPSLDMRTP